MLLGACGKQGEISTDFIKEDERSWNEQQVRIYKDPNNPDQTIVEDEYGKTVLGPNGEIISQSLDEQAPNHQDAPPVVMDTAPVAPSISDNGEDLLPETPTEETKPEITTDSLVLLPAPGEPNPVEHDHSENEEEVGTQGSITDWENFAMGLPYETVEQTDLCGEYPSLKDVMEFGHAIETLGGTFNDPSDYEHDLIGLSKYLTDSGVKYFSAYEITLPGNKKYASSCGNEILLPNKGCWLRTAAMALVADKIRSNQGQSVKMTSHHRSSCYNKKVGGSGRSDHLSSRAMDLSFGGKEQRKKAQDFICKTFWKDDLVGLEGLMSTDTKSLNISIGLGQSFMHVGLGSKHGRRYWVYKSYKEGDNADGTCWTKKL